MRRRSRIARPFHRGKTYFVSWRTISGFVRRPWPSTCTIQASATSWKVRLVWRARFLGGLLRIELPAQFARFLELDVGPQPQLLCRGDRLRLAVAVESTIDSSPEKFRRSLADDVVLWSPVVKALGSKID
jgi:hypothetical protein